MSHSEICPVCNGTGIFRVIRYEQLGTPHPFVSGPTFKYYNENPCHGCNGKGWITVEDKECIDISNHIPNIL